MESKKYGPKIMGTIFRNDYKKADNHPDYSQRGKYQLQVTDEMLRHLVDSLRADGVEPRLGISLWEKKDNNGNTSFGVQVEATAFTPDGGEEEQQQPAQRPQVTPDVPPAPPVGAYDDIPF
tara:strand:- start:946 stop:1308 length:363 start_codon:yes stop_codon:yes gene_type:complete